MKKIDLDIFQINQEIEPTGFDGLFLLSSQIIDHQILKQYLDQLHQIALENKQDECLKIIKEVVSRFENIKN